MEYKKIYESVFANPFYSTSAGRKFSCSQIHNYITDEKRFIDIGSGRGPVLLELMSIPHEQILSCDLDNYHDLEVPFESLDLTITADRDNILKTYSSFDLLTCLDVLEHIEEFYLKDVLQFFKKIARKQFIIVANHSDVQNGTQLHVTQRPYEWWKELLSECFQIVDSKSIHGNRAYVFFMH